MTWPTGVAEVVAVTGPTEVAGAAGVTDATDATAWSGCSAGHGRAPADRFRAAARGRSGTVAAWPSTAT
ncbi:MAG: hypothetical protein ACRDZY_12205 [Acidimicrobiales bacterium]